MAAQILDGKQLANRLILELNTKIKNLLASKKSSLLKTAIRPPCLAVILVGDDPASKVYVRNKKNSCAQAGITSKAYELTTTTSQEELLKLIEQLNQDQTVDGILVQLPLPKHIDNQTILEKISPVKDVDGFHPFNLGRLAQGLSSFRPCTPKGIITLLAHYELNIAGLDAVIIGKSNIVGKPMALELINAGATVTTCQRSTKNLTDKINQADLLISAAGKPHLVNADWLKPGAIVIDVGINRLANGTLVGDVDFAKAQDVASWITPVPGGVGPMTVASLLDNTFIAYQNLRQL